MELLSTFKRLLNPPEIVIDLAGGKAKIRKGKVRSRTLAELNEVAIQYNISTGRIYVIRKGRVIGLQFSGRIPPSAQQRFRNVWMAAT